MKILLADNELGYNSALAELTDKGTRLQNAVDAYTALGVATVPTTADLADLWRNPQVFLARMLTAGQDVTLGGGAVNLTVAPEKVYDLLQKPAGTPAFFAVLQTAHERGSWLYASVDPTIYELNGGVVQIRQAELDNLREQFRIYATSDKQQAEWDALQVIVSALESIRQSRAANEFNTLDYLRKALVNEGQANKLNLIRANAAEVVSAYRY